MPSVGTTPLTPLKPIKQLIPQDGGFVTVEFTNGNIMSVQPDGSVEERPPGSNGDYERAVHDGHVVIFVFGMFAYVERTP